MGKRIWNVTATTFNITVTSHLEGGYRPSIAEASLTGGEWWVNRVKVEDGAERKGIGSGLVGRLQAALVGLYAENIPPPLRVCPGGYGTPPKVQEAFYESCGFEVIDRDKLGTPMMEWVPGWVRYQRELRGELKKAVVKCT